jgi:hypothetical protein
MPKWRMVENGPSTTIYTKCPSRNCKDPSEHPIIVDSSGYRRWNNGTMIQYAFPHLSANDRERLISGICTPCWDKMFGEEEPTTSGTTE